MELIYAALVMGIWMRYSALKQKVVSPNMADYDWFRTPFAFSGLRRKSRKVVRYVAFLRNVKYMPNWYRWEILHVRIPSIPGAIAEIQKLTGRRRC